MGMVGGSMAEVGWTLAPIYFLLSGPQGCSFDFFFASLFVGSFIYFFFTLLFFLFSNILNTYVTKINLLNSLRTFIEHLKLLTQFSLRNF